MTIQVFLVGLLAVSLLTTLATQGIKVVLKEFKVNPYPNTLASIVSIVISVALAIGYSIIMSIQIDAAYIVGIVALAFLGFLCATNGYDKVKQAIEQILKGAK